MSNSVVKVTETPINDSLILVIGEDGTVTPDKETVEAYLNSRSGETELQIMQVNRSDGKNMDVTVDTLTYLANHEEEVSSYTNKTVEMEEIARNLNSFRMDHDYTPLTSPRRPDHPEEEVSEIDELAQTLSILEGSNSSQSSPQVPSISPVKVVKTTGIKTQKKLLTLNTQIANKNRFKQPQSTPVFKQPNKTTVVKSKTLKPKPPVEEPEEDHFSDEDFIMESEESEDDANDSDFDIDDALKSKSIKKTNRSRAKVMHDQSMDSSKSVKTPVKTIKTISPKTSAPQKVEPEPPKVEKPPEPVTENKAAEKKPIPKKEKKIPKPIPDDFALFSTPDIIRRVGGKQDSVTTPTTPNTPESPKSLKPAKIFSMTPIKTGGERNSIDSKEKRLSADGKMNVTEKDKQQSMHHRLSLNSETKNKEKRLSVDEKTRRHSVDTKMNSDKVGDPKKNHHVSLSTPGSNKTENHVTVQSLEESSGGNSNESIADNNLEPMPSAEDIRAIIQNENTKTFTSNLVIPEPTEQSSEQNIDQAHINLETAALDLDQSILDNINSDLISEDILYQVAQSLVDNAELQNAIDKSLVDGNLVLDTSMQQNISSEHSTPIQQHQQSTPSQVVVKVKK